MTIDTVDEVRECNVGLMSVETVGSAGEDVSVETPLAG